jgi:guanylate kinase
VVAGPSGVGKGTVVRGLLERDPHQLVYSVSATTRSPREGEIEGVHYRFVGDEEFDRMIRGGELLEWAEIVGHRSGTPRRFVEDRLAEGPDVLLEVDVKGAKQVRELMPDALLVFLLPPSFEELERRLRGRGSESEERLRERLDTARWELQQEQWFDERVVNDDLDRAVNEVAAIIEGSRSSRSDPARSDQEAPSE